MSNTNPNGLIKVVSVHEEKCVNCHACISACPVKFCNDGSGSFVNINADLCIACGNCLRACTHEARYYIDDFDQFLFDLSQGEKIVAIAAPAVAASFPNQYLKLNTWLKSLGVEAVFDVSFGAELTVKSYLEYIEKAKPEVVIAQPCAALVTYMEVYQPELLKYLAPADSPMLHTMKMIGEFYPQYKNHKIAVVSPCNAKKREFEETGLGNYNMAYLSIDKYLKDKQIDLNALAETDFDNPAAERAVLFSSPGGLLETLARWMPEARSKTRKIEGIGIIYDYLEKLPKVIEQKHAPFLIDCLSCDFGCNAGPFTLTKEESIDEIEFRIQARNLEMQQRYLNENQNDAQKSKEQIEKIINSYWKEGLYNRTYVNRWENFNIKYPNEQELKEIFASMHKYTDAHIYNCSSCGYGTCKKMATAIFNGLNRPENCHFYLTSENEISHKEVLKSKAHFVNIIESSQEGFIQIDTNGVIVNANNAFKEMLKKSDLVGRRFEEFLDNENREILQQQILLRKQNINSVYEIVITNSESEKVECLVSGTPLCEDGKSIGSFAMLTNITPLKKAQHELEDANENLENKVKKRTAQLTEAMEELRATTEMIEEKNLELEKLSIVASNTDNAVVIMSAEGEMEWVNLAFEKTYGYTLLEFSELFGKNILSASTNKEIQSAFNFCLSAKGSVSYNSTMLCKDGKKLYLQTTLSPVLSDEGEIKKVIAIDADITQIKEAEEEILQQNEEILAQTEALQESQQRLNDIIQFLPDAVLVIDNGGFVVAWNNAIETLTGVKSEDIIGKGNHEYALAFYGERRPILVDLVYITTEDLQKNYSNISVNDKILTAETYVPNLKGEKRYLVGTASPLFDGKGLIVGAIEIIRDITEKKLAEEALNESKIKLEQQAVELSELIEELSISKSVIEEINSELEQLSIVASKTDNAVAILTPTGNYEWINDGYTNIYGYTLWDLNHEKENHILNVFCSETAKSAINNSFETQKTSTFEASVLTKDKQTIWVQSTITPIFGESREIEKWVVIDTNINKLKEAEAEILSQKEEIAAQRDEIEKQRDIANEQKRYLTDSIQYASRIQAAILPTQEAIDECLPENFVLFQPKDIVSGDYFWLNQKGNKIIIAAADCTGHGVPGGFLSMLGFAFLNEIVNKYPTDQIAPSEILEQLRAHVIKSMHQTGKDHEAKDGMDIALCVIDTDKKELAFSGANNPLYFVRQNKEEVQQHFEIERKIKSQQNETHQLIQIQGDKMPIGIYPRKELGFTDWTIHYNSGNTFYICSDGYADQIGGQEGRKFLTTHFKELLLNIQSLSMEMQKEKLLEEFLNWKGENYRQIDDVLVIGFRL